LAPFTAKIGIAIKSCHFFRSPISLNAATFAKPPLNLTIEQVRFTGVALTLGTSEKPAAFGVI
jgi:hypothetical protein